MDSRLSHFARFAALSVFLMGSFAGSAAPPAKKPAPAAKASPKAPTPEPTSSEPALELTAIEARAYLLGEFNKFPKTAVCPRLRMLFGYKKHVVESPYGESREVQKLEEYTPPEFTDFARDSLISDIQQELKDKKVPIDCGNNSVELSIAVYPSFKHQVSGGGGTDPKTGGVEIAPLVGVPPTIPPGRKQTYIVSAVLIGRGGPNVRFEYPGFGDGGFYGAVEAGDPLKTMSELRSTVRSVVAHYIQNRD